MYISQNSSDRHVRPPSIFLNSDISSSIILYPRSRIFLFDFGNPFAIRS
ncbi:MAG: hypothetical protein MUE37_14360 [Bacteroidales bacterium]|nr:hypothetical protein [Bacteroidales bacterium]